MEHAPAAERFRTLLLQSRPELLNGSRQRAVLEHHCRELRSAEAASLKIRQRMPDELPGFGGHGEQVPDVACCEDWACRFRTQCEEIMRAEGYEA